MLLQQIDPSNVERAYALIERGPIKFVAAFFAVAFVSMLILFVRQVEKSRTREARLAAKHAEAIAELNQQHAERVEKLNIEDRERAIKLELAVHGLFELAEELDKRTPTRRTGRKPITSPGLPLPPPREEGADE